MTSTYGVAKALSAGIKDVSKMVEFAIINDILKIALPEQAEFIDKFGFSSYLALLPALERKFFAALTQTLEGRDMDQSTLDRSASLLKMVKDFDEKAAVADAVGERE